MAEARVVVGAVLWHRGRVLAARRTAPAAVAGRWELPGGKVEEGESAEEALVREIAEELGCRISVTGWLAGEVEIRPGLVLRVAHARLLEGEPVPREHDAVRWVRPARLAELAWLDADVPFVAGVSTGSTTGRGGSTGEGGPAARAVFFDEDDARGAVARLAAGGFDARIDRERYAGEDDDEDHPWAVTSDAPTTALELLVEDLDGWLDLPEEAPARPPLDLPSAPRRRLDP